MTEDRRDELFDKFQVLKNGEPIHECCFVLRYNSDPHARIALAAYADSCREEFPGLAADLYRELLKVESI